MPLACVSPISIRVTLETHTVRSSNDKGAIAEAAIVFEATRLGISVLKPVAEHSRYDLAFDLDGRLVRVQCKWAPLRNGAVLVRIYSSRRSAEGLRRAPYTAEEIDAVACWCDQLGRSYLVPMAIIGARGQVCLRVSPARNNQRVATNIADDYRLGAVAQLARAREWHSRGRGFESPQLHYPAPDEPEVARNHFPVRADDLRRRLGEYLQRASAGQRFVIERRGRPLARLGPLG